MKEVNLKKQACLVSIIMPIHNNNNITVECLGSIERLNYPKDKIEVIISDGATTDGTLGLVKIRLEKMRKEGFYRARLLENEIDPGPVTCLNQCYQYVDKNSKYVLKLDNDVTFASDSLIKSVSEMEGDREIGVIGGKVFYHDKLDVPAISHCACFYDLFRGRAKCYANNKSTSCDYVSGCYFLIQKEVINSYFLDEDFFVYYDDVDFCLRIKNRGYKIIYNPSVKIWHRGSVTTGGNRQSKFSIYYSARNRFLLEEKNAKLYHKLIFYPFYILNSAFRFLLQNVVSDKKTQGVKGTVPIRLKAIKDFLLRKWGKQELNERR